MAYREDLLSYDETMRKHHEENARIQSDYEDQAS